jgi:hypothetical protein
MTNKSLGKVKLHHSDGRCLTIAELIPKLNELYDEHLAILRDRNRESVLENPDLTIDEMAEYLLLLDDQNEQLRGEFLQRTLALLAFMGDDPGATEH